MNEQAEQRFDFILNRNVTYHPVEETTDYNIFGLYEENRAIVEDSIFKKLIKMIKKTGGNFTPIMVSASMKVIDGQNRRHACIKEKLPLKYQLTDITDEEAILLIPNLNAAARNFTTRTNATIAAKIGIPGYHFYMSLIDPVKAPWSAVKELMDVTDDQIQAKVPVTIDQRAGIKLDFSYNVFVYIKSNTGASPTKRTILKGLKTFEKRYDKERETNPRLTTSLNYNMILSKLGDTVKRGGVANDENIVARLFSKTYDKNFIVKERFKIIV